MAFEDSFGEMAELAGSARCDDRDRHGVCDRARQLELVAVVGSVAVHAGEEDLPRSPLGRLASPRHRVAPIGPLAPAMDVDVVCRARRPRTRSGGVS